LLSWKKELYKNKKAGGPKSVPLRSASCAFNLQNYLRRGQSLNMKNMIFGNEKSLAENKIAAVDTM
jgi:hypothetical protein